MVRMTEGSEKRSVRWRNREFSSIQNVKPYSMVLSVMA